MFLAKYNSNGEFQWAGSFGADGGGATGNYVELDNSENVFITGQFGGTLDFDFGAGTTELTGNGNIFLVKYNSSGSLSWAQSIGGTGSDEGKSIYLDSSNEVYLTGSFNNTVDFDPGRELQI